MGDDFKRRTVLVGAGIAAAAAAVSHLGGASNDASEYHGDVGGEKIQNAINALPKDGGTVVVEGDGPDDVSGHPNSTRNNAWVLRDSITLPAGTTLLLRGAHLFLADGTTKTIFVNQRAADGTDVRDAGIKILGDAETFVNGNAKNQDRTTTDETQAEPKPLSHFGLYFHKVDNVTVSGFAIGRTAGWAMGIHDFNAVDVEDIEFRQNAATWNQDGVSFIGPGVDGVATGLRGRTGDDVATIYTAPRFLSNPVGGHGDVRRVEFRDIDVTDVGQFGPGFRLQAGPTADGASTSIRNVTIRNTRTDSGSIQVRNVNDTQSYGDVADITARNVTIRGGTGIMFEGRSSDVTLTGFDYEGPGHTVWLNLKGASPFDVGVKQFMMRDVNSKSERGFLGAIDNFGLLENSAFRDISHQNIGGPVEAAHILFYTDGTVHNVSFENVTVGGDRMKEGMYCRPEATIDNLRMENFVANNVGTRIGGDCSS